MKPTAERPAMPYAPLEEHFLQASKLFGGRKLWLLPPPVEASSLVIFLDAEVYMLGVNAPTVVRGVQGAGLLTSMAAAFVSHRSAADRHVDYTCNADYAAFIAQEVLPSIVDRFPTASHDGVVIAGLSLSGLAAAFISLRFPALFRAAVCQSPSFWWENQRFADLIPAAHPPAPKFWVSVGDQETEKDIAHPPSGLLQRSTQIEGCQHVCDALRSRNYPVEEHRCAGGHDPKCWQTELGNALGWAWNE
jgi:enterochelin esterase-like enzyme